MTTLISILLSALLVLLPLPHSTQAALSAPGPIAGDSPSYSPCPYPEESKASGKSKQVASDLQTEIPALAEVCVTYGGVQQVGGKQVFDYIKLVTPLRPSNLTEPISKATQNPANKTTIAKDEPEDQAKLEVYWICNSEKNPIVKAQQTCDNTDTPISAVVSFDYGYVDPGTRHSLNSPPGRILFATAVSASNRLQADYPKEFNTVSTEELESNQGSGFPPGWPTTICSDGTLVRAPRACKR